MSIQTTLTLTAYHPNLSYTKKPELTKTDVKLSPMFNINFEVKNMTSQQQKMYDSLVELTKPGQHRYGWTVMSSKYTNYFEKMQFECPNKHTRSMLATAFKQVQKKRGRAAGCGACNKFSRETGEKKLLEIIKKRGGKLASKYETNNIDVKIICENGHPFTVLPRTVVHSDVWCMECPRQVMIKKLGAKLKENEGEADLSSYKTCKDYMTFKCKNGHEWSAVPDSIITGRWCAKCLYYETRSKGERLLESIFAMLELPFTPQSKLPEYPKAKYDFLVHYKSQDIYFEFDGQAHFDLDNGYFNKTEEDYEMCKQRDIRKTKIVLDVHKKRMIRLTFNTLKASKEELKNFLVNAMNSNIPLLLIDYIEKKLVINTKLPLYDWLTSSLTT